MYAWRKYITLKGSPLKWNELWGWSVAECDYTQKWMASISKRQKPGTASKASWSPSKDSVTTGFSDCGINPYVYKLPEAEEHKFASPGILNLVCDNLTTTTKKPPRSFCFWISQPMVHEVHSPVTELVCASTLWKWNSYQTI